jgi:hypothetical protein
MARESGVFQFPANFEVEKAAPLDARQACGLLSDMYVLPYQFKGMIVSVTDESQADDNGTYVCINPAQPGGTSADVDWEKLGSGSEGAQGAQGPQGANGSNGSDGQGVIGGDENSPEQSDSSLFPDGDWENYDEIPDGTMFIGAEGDTWVVIDGQWEEVGNITGPPGPITLAGDEDDPNDASGLPASETLIDGQMYIGSEGTTWIWDSAGEAWDEVGFIGGAPGPQGPAGANGTTFTQWSEDSNGNMMPSADVQYDIGTTETRVKEIFTENITTGDINLNNEGRQNEVDGTSGHWSIQEGSSDLFLINRNTGKKYKFNLTEIEE